MEGKARGVGGEGRLWELGFMKWEDMRSIAKEQLAQGWVLISIEAMAAVKGDPSCGNRRAGEDFLTGA